MNSGHRNSGDWNSCDYESGFFNSEQSDVIRVFGKPCLRKSWEDAEKPDCLYFELTEWVKDDSKTEGGYLKAYSYKEAFTKSMENASQEELEMVKALPNFDADIFYEISGYRFDRKRTITIDGKDIEISEESFQSLKYQLCGDEAQRGGE